MEITIIAITSDIQYYIRVNNMTFNCILNNKTRLLHNSISNIYSFKQAFYKKKQNDNQKGRQHVDGFAVFDAEDAETGGGDEGTAGDAEFGAEIVGNGIRREFGCKVEHSLPAEEDGGCPYHADAVCGGKYRTGNEVKRCIYKAISSRRVF